MYTSKCSSLHTSALSSYTLSQPYSIRSATSFPFLYLEVEIFPRIYQDKLKALQRSQQSYLLFLPCDSIDWNSSHSSCSLGCNFHSENLVGILISGSYNCNHFHAMESIISLWVLTLWSALRATY